MFKRVALSVAAVIFVYSAAIAIAQTNAPEQPKEFTLTVNGADIDTIGRALGSLPYNAVAQLMGKLQMQIVQQQKADEEKAKAAKK